MIKDHRYECEYNAETNCFQKTIFRITYDEASDTWVDVIPNLIIVIDLSRNLIIQEGTSRELSSVDKTVFDEMISWGFGFNFRNAKYAIYKNKFFQETYMSEPFQSPPEYVKLYWFNPNTSTIYKTDSAYIRAIHLRDNTIYEKIHEMLTLPPPQTPTTNNLSSDYCELFYECMENIDATDDLVSALLESEYYVNTYLPDIHSRWHSKVDIGLLKSNNQLIENILWSIGIVLPYERLYSERFLKPKYADRITAKYDDTHIQFLRILKQIFRGILIIPGTITGFVMTVIGIIVSA